MSRELRKSSATPGTVDTTLKFAGYDTTSDFVKVLYCTDSDRIHVEVPA